MQEIVLILSSVAGAATAAALRKIPKPKNPIQTLRANSQIKNKIHSLSIEKEILTKTISRLYQNESGLPKIQRDRLLIRYQHQFGLILSKMEKLEEASKHPDLGPVGDGLITLMDQKLSQLDKRLYELSSKISLTNTQIPENKKKSQEKIKIVKEDKEHAQPQIQKEISQETNSTPVEVNQDKPKSFEITTLTEIPTKISEFPSFDHERKQTIDLVRKQIEKPQSQLNEKIEILQTSIGSTMPEKPQLTLDLPKTEIISEPEEKKPKPTIKLPEEEKFDDDEDDLDKIKGEIMKTLSKLEQAEVE
jgi:hypothetical protein